MLKERERLQVKKNALAFFSSSLESLQAMDKQTWSHHIPQSLSYQVSAGDMCGNLLARFTQNCTDFHRLRRRIHHRLGTIGGMRSHFSWLRVGTLASHRVDWHFFTVLIDLNFRERREEFGRSARADLQAVAINKTKNLKLHPPSSWTSAARLQPLTLPNGKR